MASPSSHASARPLRIAHVTTTDMSLALLLATELAVDVGAGHDVYGISAPGRYVDRVEQLGVRHVPVKSLSRSWGLRSDAKAFVELVRTVRRLDLDVLHTHNPKTGVMGRIAGRLAGVPVVVNTCHGLWASPEDSLKKRAFVYGLEGLACRFSDFELFQNAEDQRTLRRVLRRGRASSWATASTWPGFRRPRCRDSVAYRAGRCRRRAARGRRRPKVEEKGVFEFAEMASALKSRARFAWVGPSDGEETMPGGGLPGGLHRRTNRHAGCVRRI